MTFSPGAIVKAGSFGDSVWVVRCPAARPGYWHLQNKIVGRSTSITRIARTGELRLVAPAPTFKVGETVKYEGREATVIADLGDEVTIVAGLSRVDAPKSELVLARL
jgi:hypothetical protein